jgi:hypothetical protein
LPARIDLEVFMRQAAVTHHASAIAPVYLLAIILHTPSEQLIEGLSVRKKGVCLPNWALCNGVV